MSNPEARTLYECNYPDGAAVFWRSDTDSTVLGWNTGAM
jgi:hypothetical protein